jgi:selenophosphate synthase
LADPQTSGGLLIAVNKDKTEEVIHCLKENGLEQFVKPIGYMKENELTIIQIN